MINQPTIRIEPFSLIDNTFVILKIFDILGREIATVVNEEMELGKYKYIFDLNKYKLSSGVYFYSLEIGNKRFIKKTALIK